jgi:hypothetical protein
MSHATYRSSCSCTDDTRQPVSLRQLDDLFQSLLVSLSKRCMYAKWLGLAKAMTDLGDRVILIRSTGQILHTRKCRLWDRIEVR